MQMQLLKKYNVFFLAHSKIQYIPVVYDVLKATPT